MWNNNQKNIREGGYQSKDKYPYHDVIANVMLGMYNVLMVNKDEKTFKLLASLIFLRADRLLPKHHKHKGKIISFKNDMIIDDEEGYVPYTLSMLDSLTTKQIWVAMTEKQKEAGMVEVEIFKTNSLLSKLQERGDID